MRRNALKFAAVAATALIPAGFSATTATAATTPATPTPATTPATPATATTPAVSEIATPNVESFNITAGPLGSVWYTASGPGTLNQIGEIPADGDQPSYYDQNIIQPGQEGEGGLQSITQGPDKNLWFTQSAEPSSAGAGVVYRISSGVGTSGDGPLGAVKYNRADGILPDVGGITSGPNGRLWFTESSGATGASEEIGSIGVHGGVTAPIPGGPSIPGAITEGPAGNLYFAEPSIGTIARLSPAGTVTTVLTGISGLRDLIYADDALWFTASNAVGTVATTGTGLQMTQLTVDPDQIVAGPGSGSVADELWFTTSSTVTGSGGRSSGAIGMITPSDSPGVPPTVALLTQGITGLGTFGITATATQVWFTEGAYDRLGVISF
jgi:streptogramin lyase